jgi:DNA-binding NarL/FixJ family response regulator
MSGHHTEDGPLRIVLAEDTYLVREGIKLLVEAADDVELVADCGDLPSLLDAVDEHRPDVVVTDIRMPPTNTDEGIQAALTLRDRHPDLGVVVLSQYVEPSWAHRLLEGGSAGRGYLLKERVGDLGELTRAIRTVADGGSVIDPKVVDTLVQARMRRNESLLARLTARELEVLAEIAQGRNNAGIAASLVLTERAVEKHIGSIFAKLDLAPDEDDHVHRRVRAVLLYLAEQEQDG